MKEPGQATISRILKQEASLNGMTGLDLKVKRRRIVNFFRELDKAFARWVLQCAGKKICLTGDLIKLKARAFSEALSIPEAKTPEFSDGWL